MAGITWRDNLIKAEFAGARFKVDGSTTEVGRRNILHKYPFRDEAFNEDVGQDPDTFNITGYVIQDAGNLFNYFRERDKLRDKLKEGGVKPLKHPFYGEIKKVVLVGKAEIVESFREGGIARFKMTFTEASDEKGKPGSNKEDANDSSKFSLQSAIDAFAEAYSTAFELTEDFNSYVSMVKSTIRSVEGVVSASVSLALTTITNLSTQITAVGALPCDIANAVAGMSDAYLIASGLLGQAADDFTSGACTGRKEGSDQAINQADKDNQESKSTSSKKVEPQDSSIDNSVSGSEVLSSEKGRSSIKASLALADYGTNGSIHGGNVTSVNVTSEDRASRSLNKVLLINLAKVTGLSAAAKMVTRIDFKNSTEAFNTITDIITKIDIALDSMGADANNDGYSTFFVNSVNDSTYSLLQGLKADLTDILLRLGARLGEQTTYAVPAGIISTLQLAYDKYEDLSKAIDIEKNNSDVISHPGFLPEGETINVLGV